MKKRPESFSILLTLEEVKALQKDLEKLRDTLSPPELNKYWAILRNEYPAFFDLRYTLPNVVDLEYEE